MYREYWSRTSSDSPHDVKLVGSPLRRTYRGLFPLNVTTASQAHSASTSLYNVKLKHWMFIRKFCNLEMKIGNELSEEDFNSSKVISSLKLLLAPSLELCPTSLFLPKSDSCDVTASRTG